MRPDQTKYVRTIRTLCDSDHLQALHPSESFLQLLDEHREWCLSRDGALNPLVGIESFEEEFLSTSNGHWTRVRHEW